MKLEALRKTFPDGTQAVRAIDLEIPDGSFAVLLGPSGCGKTTTLRMIAGLETPTSGRVVIGGQDVTSRPASERNVGFVFQFYALYPHLRVRDNIGFPLDNEGLKKRDRNDRVCKIAEKLGITQLLDRHPSQLSGGDQQRVSLARAMVRNPDLFLMDEPLGQMDASIRLELRETIRAQQQETRTTTVYVTHDQEEALSLGDVIVVMNNGEIEQVGSPKQIYNDPQTLFVANFVGSPGMNLFEGQISSSQTFECDDLEVSLPQVAHRGPAVLGIRPEAVTTLIDPNQATLPGKVRVSEYYGDHHILHVDTPAGKCVVRTNTARLGGDGICLGFDADRIRIFDPASGRRVA